jgi:hypothetical protein
MMGGCDCECRGAMIGEYCKRERAMMGECDCGDDGGTSYWDGHDEGIRTAMVSGVVVCKCVTDGFYVLVPFYFCTKLMCTLVGLKYTIVRCPDWYQHVQ